MSGSKEYQKVTDFLQEEIRLGNLTIGSRLPTERALAEKLKVSRNSTREALRMLEYAGVIESKRGSGSYLVGAPARSISSMIQMMILLKQTDKKEVVEFRRAVEKANCLMLIAHDDLTWLDEVERILSDDSGDLEAHIQNDIAFHYALIGATGNQFWISIMGAISEVYLTWVTEGLAAVRGRDDISFDESHLALAKALKARDRTACEKAIDKHYDDILKLFSEQSA